MNKNQITLDKTKAYDISKLNEEQIEQIAEATGDCDVEYLTFGKNKLLYHCEMSGWTIALFGENLIKQDYETIINAKTLFN